MNILEQISSFGFIRYFPDSRADKLYTHLYTTFFHNIAPNASRRQTNKMKKRTISMCQAFEQRSIRAIIKLKCFFK